MIITDIYGEEAYFFLRMKKMIRNTKKILQNLWANYLPIGQVSRRMFHQEQVFA